MSAEYLLNDDLPDDSRPKETPPKRDITYYDLMQLRIEAGARLSRAIKTLRDAHVLPDADKGSNSGLKEALELAERYWAEICMGLVPIRSGADVLNYTLYDDRPACIEAFRVIVMEHAQRNALELECRNRIDHLGGFKILTRTQLLHLEEKHICDGTCNHD